MNRVTTEPWSYIDRITLKGFQSEAMRDNDGLEFTDREIRKLESMEFPNFPDNCWTLDLSKHLSNFTPLKVKLFFRVIKDFSVEVLVEDRLTALARASAFAKFAQKSGAPIVNTDHKQKTFVLANEQEIFDENDENIGCKNYPTEHHPTFKDCDKDYTQKILAKVKSQVLCCPFPDFRKSTFFTPFYTSLNSCEAFVLE